jgi:hypothetical protein
LVAVNSVLCSVHVFWALDARYSSAIAAVGGVVVVAVSGWVIKRAQNIIRNLVIPREGDTESIWKKIKDKEEAAKEQTRLNT